MPASKTGEKATITTRRLGTLLRYNLNLLHTDFGGAMRFSEHRRQYTLSGLRRDDLRSDPVELFTQWQSQAINAGLADPTACVLATGQAGAGLRQRMVLMKGVDERGLVFYTNYQSGKAVALAESEQASMLFPWNELDRQVSVTGSVTQVDEQTSDDYFASRPRDSQLGAWASAQSQAIDSRDALLAQWDEVKRRFGDEPIPRPPHWGGYRLAPLTWEFWQGGENRLHDRFRYQRVDDGWEITRLQP